MKKIRNITLGVTAVLAVAVLVVLALAWRASSFSVSPSQGREAVETYRFRTDAFSLDIPATYEFQGFVGALRWAGGYITFLENWYADREKFDESFSQSLAGALENGGRDVSDYLGRTAVVQYRDYDGELGSWQPVILLSVKFPQGRVGFFQMASGPAADLPALEEPFLAKVRDFLTAYTMDEASPPENTDGMRTRHGVVARQPRQGYVYSIDSASFSSGDGNIYLGVVPEEERQIKRPGFTGKIGRFFSELDRTGYMPGTSLEDMALDGWPGHEIIKKHPFFDDGEFIVEMEWTGEPQAEFGHQYSLQISQMTQKVTKDNQGDIYADWLALLDSLKFEKPAGDSD